MPDFYIHGQIHNIMYIIMSSFETGMCVGKCGHGMDNYFINWYFSTHQDVLIYYYKLL